MLEVIIIPAVYSNANILYHVIHDKTKKSRQIWFASSLLMKDVNIFHVQASLK